MAELTHVIFELDVVDGWPPVSAERVWAEQVGPDSYRVKNAPWFAVGIAEDDIVRAVPAGTDEWPRFAQHLSWSGNCTIRLVVFRDGPFAGDLQRAMSLFSPLGATGEAAEMYGMLALTVPPDAELASIKRLLRAGEHDHRWSFEEGCIGDRWIRA